ncbi:MAG: hypothetical protein IKJ84_05330 [Oscillospiraceae bacterium]|nr:hypothetical protein [Oscillospiraceae bacterium]
MTVREQVFQQALLLAGEVDQKNRALLGLLCEAAAAALASRLREGLTAADCGRDFVMAASLYALADLWRLDGQEQVEEFKAGDLTVRQGGVAPEGAAECLQKRAEALMKPYLRDPFAFLGV